MRSYAGIGSRETPRKILEVMTEVALWLQQRGWTLRTGAAKGADQAFAAGAGADSVLCLPWQSYEQDFVYMLKSMGAKVEVLEDEDAAAFAAVDKYHPAAGRLSQGARRLHARNHSILKGVSFVICWTPDGKISGGTGQALREALARKIKIFNLAKKEDLERILTKIGE
jgi:hypothetical protein